ncbi:tetratricopeptide repeat (TPR)-like superfamily protein [Actinidia rufa]|uniref:Tetratricopeptide repeat (TPR)-like superfamily protein n=1 Tax=Actinidia rufa TaxID=165716 RepID=A0A7J0GUX6_9ERIC|nr:tetratricopeptide repeat (TPR)-like superfamily protein [Actinidia rufa]
MHLGKRGHVVEAEKVFTSCQEYKKPSVMEFNVMIKAYGINKKFDKACQLFDSMEKHDVVPDKCSFSSLIQILASAELPHLAVIYVRKNAGSRIEMVGFNVRPDVIVFGVLINAFADIGSVKQALRYVDGMEEAGIPMNSVIYKSLIKLYTKVGYLKETEETFKKLQSIERLGRLDKAIRIAQKMRKLGLMTDLLSYNHVLSLYASDGRFKEAVRTFKEMMESSLQPNDSTFKSLGVLLMKCGVPEQAIGEMELTRKMNAQSGLKSWVSTLCSVVSVDNYEVDGKINAFAWDRKGFYV